jgi:hypothetical protein
MASDNPETTAGFLIDQAGGVKEARAFITKAARARANPRGKPMTKGDGALLAAVDVVQNADGISFPKAARKIALEIANGDEDAADKIFRRLRDRNKKRRFNRP